MQEKRAMVSGFARSFVSGNPIADAKITVVENDQITLYTDAAGMFGPLEWPVGQPITFVLEKPGSFWSGYKTTQTGTFIVPPEGINDKNYLKNISFQVPSNMAYSFITFASGQEEGPQGCQIATTITPPNMTLDDIPQGIEGVTASLSPKVDSNPFYFGIFPVTNKTNPFVRTLTATSLDGGVLFSNVPPGEYTIRAEREGMVFSEVKVKARAGVLVNASPPNGPTLLHGAEHKGIAKTNSYSFFKPALALGVTVAVGACVVATACNR